MLRSGDAPAGARRLPGALAALLREAPLSDGKVSFAWRTAVGPALERVSSARLDGRTLVVEADNAQWAREVSRSASVILGRREDAARLPTPSGRFKSAEEDVTEDWRLKTED